ncbi:hypothetical protein M3Y96_00097700 [Aphelenchoides besseyi]|nr:hypothetical protein M3Y96_00097700 [Aphelenchoides besseyi]
MGVATLDLERPLMIVQQTISLSIDYGDSHSSFIPLSHSRSLHEGLILQPSMLKPFHYFLLKMERGNQLSATRINVPVKMRPFGCFNGVLYGLVDSVVGTTGGEELKVFDLAKLSLSNGEYVQKSTSNFELLKLPNHFYPFKIPNNMCCVGNKLFVYNTCLQENKMLSLDLVTLKWKSEMIPAKSVQLLGTDGKRSLIVFGGGNLIKPNVCRHVVNQPDKLIDLAWFQLKRIFDDRPSSYEFIARQLPYTFKRKNPFPHL